MKHSAWLGYTAAVPMQASRSANRLGLAVALAALLMTAADPAAAQTVPPGRPAVQQTADAPSVERVTEEHFSFAVPAGWQRQGAGTFGLTDDEKKTFGVTLDGPRYGEIPLRISVIYYAPGNLVHKSVEDYLRVFSQPALGVALEGSHYGKVERTSLSGREAMVFERSRNEYRPMSNTIGLDDRPSGREGVVYERREMMARPVPVKERFVVLPAKPGFYALRYSAAAADFPEFLPAFEELAAGFQARH